MSLQCPSWSLKGNAIAVAPLCGKRGAVIAFFVEKLQIAVDILLLCCCRTFSLELRHGIKGRSHFQSVWG